MIYIVDLESVDTRYTCEWKEYLPQQLRNAGADVTVISGGDVPQTVTPGAFLNFAGTNNYKSQQMIKISELVANGKVKDGDYFLYTDAWNPTVIQLKYMLSLLGINAKIGGLWHAGSYDPQDFLGRLIGNQPWVRNAETTMYFTFDHNFFATRFHLDLFASTLFDMAADQLGDTVQIVGWPMEYLPDLLGKYTAVPKKNKIIFPHRLAPEKQPEIFRDLAESLPEYEWFAAQDQRLTKDEYHMHLAESKIMFSANLQETLGISAYEAALIGTYPMLPNRLSYCEMWDESVTYPSEWTKDWASYLENKSKLITKIREIMTSNRDISSEVRSFSESTGQKFFNGKDLYSTIIGSTRV